MDCNDFEMQGRKKLPELNQMWNSSLKKNLEMGACSLQVGRWWVLRLGHIYSRCEIAVKVYKIETNNIFKWDLFYRSGKPVKALKKMWIRVHDLKYSWSLHDWLRYTGHKNLGTCFWGFREGCWCLLNLISCLLLEALVLQAVESGTTQGVITMLSCEMLALTLCVCDIPLGGNVV